MSPKVEGLRTIETRRDPIHYFRVDLSDSAAFDPLLFDAQAQFVGGNRAMFELKFIVAEDSGRETMYVFSKEELHYDFTIALGVKEMAATEIIDAGRIRLDFTEGEVKRTVYGTAGSLEMDDRRVQAYRLGVLKEKLGSFFAFFLYL